MRKLLLLAVAGAGVLLTGIAASASAASSPVRVASAADEQPSIVEDYTYPGADKIYADLGFKLISGDGHILLADCPATTGNDGFIRVRRNLKPTACFKVTGSTGSLTMEIPEVTFIKGDDHTLKATIAGQTGTIDIVKNEWTPLPGDKGSTLVSLAATP